MEVDSEGFFIVRGSDSSDVPDEIGTVLSNEDFVFPVDSCSHHDPDLPDDEPSLPGFSFPKRKSVKPSVWSNLVITPGDVKCRPIVKPPVKVKLDIPSDEEIDVHRFYRILATIENTPRQVIRLGQFEWNAEGECSFPSNLGKRLLRGTN